MKPTDAPPHPPDWGTATVGAAIEIRRGVSWKKNQEHKEPRPGRVPVIRVGNVQDALELDDMLYLAGIKPVETEKGRVSKDWSIIVGSNGNRSRVGNAVFIRQDAEFLFASFLLGACPKAESEITPEYFFRWLSSDRVQAYLSASSEGTTGLNNLSHSFFKAMSISVPSPPEQDHVVSTLAALDDAILGSLKVIDSQRRLRRSLIDELLRDGLHGESHKKTAIGDMPSSWDCVALKSHIGLGPINGLYKPESEYGPRGTRIVRIDSFNDGVIEDVETLRRVVVAPIIRKRYELHEGDILINRVNSLSHIGKSAIVSPLSEAMLFESNIMMLQCSDGLLPEFLNVVLCSDIARRHWLSRAKPAVNQSSINQRDVEDLHIPLPEPDEQREIAKMLRILGGNARARGAVLTAQHRLKARLTEDLLQGRWKTGTIVNGQVSMA